MLHLLSLLMDLSSNTTHFIVTIVIFFCDELEIKLRENGFCRREDSSHDSTNFFLQFYFPPETEKQFCGPATQTIQSYPTSRYYPLVCKRGQGNDANT
jgi:hypothetical protein